MTQRVRIIAWRAALPILKVLVAWATIAGAITLAVGPFPRLYAAEAMLQLALLAAALIVLLRIGFGRLPGLRAGHEAEIYVTVLSIGVSIVLLSSVAAWALFRLGAAEYELDSRKGRQMVAQYDQQRFSDSIELAAFDTLAERLKRGTGSLALEPLERGLLRGLRRRAIAPELGKWNLYVKVYVAGGEPSPPFVEFESADEHVVLYQATVLDGPRSQPWGIADSSTTLSRQAVLVALRQRGETTLQAQASRADLALRTAPSVFLYQGAMAFLGANPGYLSPANTVAEALALLGATFRTLFAALVLSMFVKGWASKAQ